MGTRECQNTAVRAIAVFSITLLAMIGSFAHAQTSEPPGFQLPADFSLFLDPAISGDDSDLGTPLDETRRADLPSFYGAEHDQGQVPPYQSWHLQDSRFCNLVSSTLITTKRKAAQLLAGTILAPRNPTP
jgi:hypothetical protein